MNGREKFEQWLKGEVDLVTLSEKSAAHRGWQAALSTSQPEIDALKAELENSNVLIGDASKLIIKLKAENEKLRDAAGQAHSLLGELLAEATGDEEKEIYRVFDLLRFRLGIYAQMHPLDAAITPDTEVRDDQS